MAARSSILAWRIHGQRGLEGYSAQGHTVSDMTKATWHEGMHPYYYLHRYSVKPLGMILSKDKKSVTDLIIQTELIWKFCDKFDFMT